MIGTILTIALQLAASGADAYYTDRNLSQDQSRYVVREDNPVSRLFVQTRAGRVAYFSVTAGIKIALPQILRKHHHNRVARILEISDIADNATCAAESAIHTTGRK